MIPYPVAIFFLNNCDFFPIFSPTWRGHVELAVSDDEREGRNVDDA